MTDSLTLRRPDDWHVHFRDGAMLRSVLPCTVMAAGVGPKNPKAAGGA